MYLNLDSRRDTNENGFEILTVEDINAVIWSWPKLKTLYVSNLDSISRSGINLKNSGELQIFGTTKGVETIASLIENGDLHNLAFRPDAAFDVNGNSSGVLQNIGTKDSLEKIIVSPKPGQQIRGWLNWSKRYSNEKQLKELIGDPRKVVVEKFWLDPKNITRPIKIENVLGIHFVRPSDNEIDAFLKKNRPWMIETLSINPGGLNKPRNFDWILSFKNLKKLTIVGDGLHSNSNSNLDFDFSYMLDVLKKIHGMKTIGFESCKLEKEFFDQFLKQLPPGQTLIIQANCYFFFHITSLLENLNSLGEMKEKKILKIFDTIDGKQLVFKILNDLDEEKTMEIFKEAQEIIDKKFDELDIFLRDSMYGLWLFKEKGKVCQINDFFMTVIISNKK